MSLSPLLSTLLAVGVSVATLSACNPYDPDLGERPFRCGTDEPICPDGYECVQETPADQICVRTGGGGSAVDAGPGAPDAGPFVCNDDNELEPNDTIQTATLTPIPDLRQDYSLVRLAICPTTDVDIFRFRIESMAKNMKATVQFNSGVGALTLDILNSTGSPIATASGGTNPDVKELIVRNMPIGVYYVKVGAAAGVQNNYQLNILTTTDPI